MKEQLISFETAKLAKEKGFDIRSYQHQFNRNTTTGGFYEAVSQSFLQKWLREEKDTHVNVMYQGIEFDVEYVSSEIKPTKLFRFKTYEKALEKGLKEALKLITNKHK